MKLVINYDLVDKLAEAKNGYSLKRCIKRTLGLAGISTLIGAPDNLISGNITPDLLIEISAFLAIHGGYTATFAWTFKGMTMENARRKLSDLVKELRSSCIGTDEESILESRKYKSEYDVQFNSIIPTIEQKKYFMVPVHDEIVGDKEISIMQEHTVGTRDYIISLGEPKEQKTYSLNMKTLRGR